MDAKRTPPVNWAKVLDRFSVPKRQGIYVLGCFARHLTLYSQQVRALNLVAALCHTGELKTNTQLAVIGGGRGIDGVSGRRAPRCPRDSVRATGRTHGVAAKQSAKMASPAYLRLAQEGMGKRQSRPTPDHM